MKIVNQTPFQFALFLGRMNFPGYTLTLIVKATFDLLPDKKVQPSDEQLYPTGDEFFPDDVDMIGAPRYEADFAYFKPKTDILLSGHCHAPGGKPVSACPVEFRIGPITKTLHVFGDRFWKNTIGIRTISDPIPFTKMELRYENSFGGQGFKKNPIGKGHKKESSVDGKKKWPLPNIEDPQHLSVTPGKDMEPVGFGPLHRMWEQRFLKMGTYKSNYLKKRWPWFAEDFDYAHFNATHPDMQVEGYLRGDESVSMKNLHPTIPLYQSQLPGRRVRCFLDEGNGKTDPQALREVRMNLDTLFMDADKEKLVLVWRGVTEVTSEDYEDDVQHIFIMAEALDGQQASIEDCHKTFLTILAEQEEELEMAPEEPPEPDPEEAPEPEIPQEEIKKQIAAQTSALLAALGMDMENLQPEAREKIQKDQDQIIDKIMETDPEKKAAMEDETLRAQMAAALSTHGIDMDHLPLQTDKAKEEQLRLLKELKMDDPAFLQDPDMMSFIGIMGALAPKMGIDPEDLSPIIEEAKKQQGIIKKKLGITDEEEGQPPPALTREMVLEKAAQGESLAGTDLSGLDLSGLDLKGVDCTSATLAGTILTDAVLIGAVFSGAKAEGVGFKNADLTRANLSEADLSKADLENTCLKDADLTEAILAGAVLTGAVLTDAVFEKANMQGSVLKDVEAVDTTFSEADLTGATLTAGHFSSADFSYAILNDAIFQKARLREASLEGAHAMNANFTEADLTELRASEGGVFSKSVFIKAIGTGSMWQESKLDEADFSFAQMQEADFTKASLEKADLTAADMKSARFMKANLRHAKMVLMNLFEANMKKADLTGADLSGANMYSVEFLDAIIDKTIMKGTNLKMTKLV